MEELISHSLIMLGPCMLAAYNNVANEKVKFAACSLCLDALEKR